MESRGYNAPSVLDNRLDVRLNIGRGIVSRKPVNTVNRIGGSHDNIVFLVGRTKMKLPELEGNRLITGSPVALRRYSLVSAG